MIHQIGDTVFFKQLLHASKIIHPMFTEKMIGAGVVVEVKSGYCIVKSNHPVFETLYMTYGQVQHVSRYEERLTARHDDELISREDYLNHPDVNYWFNTTSHDPR